MVEERSRSRDLGSVEALARRSQINLIVPQDIVIIIVIIIIILINNPGLLEILLAVELNFLLDSFFGGERGSVIYWGRFYRLFDFCRLSWALAYRLQDVPGELRRGGNCGGKPVQAIRDVHRGGFGPPANYVTHSLAVACRQNGRVTRLAANSQDRRTRQGEVSHAG